MREDIERAQAEAQGLGLFVRSLVGLDREAAKEAFAGFLSGQTPTANQIEFVNLIVNHLTEHGVMDAARLYESPFTDLAARAGRAVPLATGGRAGGGAPARESGGAGCLSRQPELSGRRTAARDRPRCWSARRSLARCRSA